MQIHNRSRWRMENKRRFYIPFVVLALAIVFALGVIVGRGGRAKTVTLPVAATVPAAPAAKPTVAPPATKELTFYDTLPKGEPAPLGSGINLPRDTPRAEGPATAAVPPSSPPASAAPAAITPGESSPDAPGQGAAATEPSAASAAPPAPPAGKGRWVIQAASFKTAEDAEKMRQRLAGKGFKATIREADLGAKGTWYRVVIGPYASGAEADQAAGRLQKEGLSGLVRKD